MDAELFGAFVQTRRKELGMNQAQLADKLHVTAKAVSRWERGVGFPDIKLLQPLADALEITIAELMQSRKIEDPIPKEEADKLVSQTVDAVRKQEAISWKRKLILYGGYLTFFLMYSFLYLVGEQIRFEYRWIGFGVAFIDIFIWHFGCRALYCLVTGASFFEGTWQWKKKNWKVYAAMLCFAAGIALILLAMACIPGKALRDFLAVLGLLMAFFSGLYITVFNRELNQ